MVRIMPCLMAIILAAGSVAGGQQEKPVQTSGPTQLSDLEKLGRNIYFDAFLSSPPGQSCATCHDPSVGWTGPRSDINQAGGIYPGAVPDRFGNRKPPSAAYATQSPVLQYDAKEKIFLGGNFWDGRATGWLLGQPAAEQAQDPFLNPVEHNLPDAAAVVTKVCGATYGDQFRAIYGNKICADAVDGYNAIGQALFAYENSGELNAFDSKYDYYLRDSGQYPLTDQELLGLKLYEDENKGRCAECHPSRPGPDGAPPLFTDFSYANLGFPKNQENATYRMPKEFNPDGAAWIDPGLGGFLAGVPRFAHLAGQNLGKHKVPTLRNIDKRALPGFVKAFGHNGVFKDLKEIVHFHNTRDILPACEAIPDANPGLNCWGKPEVAANLNTEELGNLGLTEEEEWAIVAFLQTLNDGWLPGGR